jgi:uncharacterized SAM-binding protein YcdF (DUF218 family)
MVVLAAAVLIAAGVLGFRFAAYPLVRSDPPMRADLIVVLATSRLERTLEAAMLVREGWSQRVLLMHPADSPRSAVLRQLGVDVPTFYAIQRRALSQMHIPDDAIFESDPNRLTTRDEARYIVDFARQRGYRRIIVVTSPYHTRRAGSLIRRAAGDDVEVLIRANRYETIHPARWWQYPSDRTDVVFEYLKIVHALGYF